MSSKIQTFISKLIFKYLKILIMMFKKKQANKAIKQSVFLSARFDFRSQFDQLNIKFCFFKYFFVGVYFDSYINFYFSWNHLLRRVNTVKNCHLNYLPFSFLSYGWREKTVYYTWISKYDLSWKPLCFISLIPFA